MPTSYTAPIEEGNLNARDFVSHCARAFGAFAHQREEDIDIPPTPVEISLETYYQRELREQHEKYRTLVRLTDTEIEAQWRQYFDEVTQSNIDRILKYKEQVARYQTVKDKVEAWQPNDEAKPLKDYALNQIEISWPYNPHIFEPYETPEEWYDHEVARALKNIDYYEEESEKEFNAEVQRREYGVKMLESIADVPE